MPQSSLRDQTYVGCNSTSMIKTEAVEVWGNFCDDKDKIEKCELNLSNMQTEDFFLKEEPVFEAGEDLNISENDTNSVNFSDNDNRQFKIEDDFKFSPNIGTKVEWQEISLKTEITEEIDEKVNSEFFQDTSSIEIIKNPLEIKLDNSGNESVDQEIKNTTITCYSNRNTEHIVLLNKLNLDDVAKNHHDSEQNSCLVTSVTNKNSSGPMAKPLFECQECHMNFTRKYTLHSHIVSKHSNNEKAMNTLTYEVHSCEICEYKTIERRKLKIHLQMHKGVEAENKYHCSICDYKTVYQGNLGKHIVRKHTDIRLFDCQNCNEKFKFKRQLDGHILSKHSGAEKSMFNVTSKVHNSKMYEYKTANARSNLKFHLQQHNKAVDSSKDEFEKFICNVCDYETTYKYNLKIHIMRKHTNLRPLHCQNCNKKFKFKHVLDGHILSKHSDNEQAMNTVTSKIHSCEMCEFKTVDRCKLKVHLQIHESVEEGKKFHCSICDYRAVYKGNLVKHFVRRHSDLRHFHCQNCNQKYKFKYELDGHILSKHSDNEEAMNTITSEVHFCEMCEFKTTLRSRLRSHLRRHTNLCCAEIH